MQCHSSARNGMKNVKLFRKGTGTDHIMTGEDQMYRVIKNFFGIPNQAFFGLD